ncbi:mannose-1-phosphate guanylyltransferase/mannose-6-phosphate isomerase [bacterium M00.F.Ca.ET.228.01.1.1]|uniref:mannose-1-phosphate guanylyltransferase/mannose-6-phosphate isomerase n=1 Tax=Paraburkholderia phenoliruptrix TaxID=252970 RepID=UPI0010932ABF|nr:mannose-1-phosphate guanylyltransferase/mannose-6-phosphate isomerase [Paraburkholderia phenoliruptrix]TGP43133.1 mannose-1-phosphate guanylyltransferase/mannose-6-phosphate isomerase [bacterium M00.F.Ca.ET.228.01.1.1]TGS00572.1 mannose-1-phosphate guanylyltransferase/mannose-6-phosphate isomerase [bacterium M00.F.Ca.ET.191.01.1.1]TGU04958.1 mannose-1-phosphate guanylyltransferase/mannose-6-phosphate isomerase [bacterium M00.F.Ca.ET.155.01.1.1]MBW0446935.1 mannose-1-phosphate guanylyltransfe
MNSTVSSQRDSASPTHGPLPLQAVILAGGSGTRLWPLSRDQFPKQLIGLLGEESLLQSTARRLDAVNASRPVAEQVLVVCGEDHRFTTAEQLRRVGRSGVIILEPVGRNTAPALTLAALALVQGGNDAIMVAMPADHAIRDVATFADSVAKAAEYAEAGQVVTLGIVPTRPETGYGYIKVGEAVGKNEGHRLERFVEKPNLDLAQSYLNSGDFWWNSGIFVLRASVWLRLVEHYHPLIAEAARRAFDASVADQDFLRVGKEEFVACPSESIDFAVMEHLGDPDSPAEGVVIPLQAGWSDVGSWDAIWDLLPKDGEGNVARGRAMFDGAVNTFAHSEGRLIACVGTENLVVVETPDAILVAKTSEVQRVKNIVARIKAENGTEAQYHRKVSRPWGYYDSIDSGRGFQVKRIVVNPGCRLSLQMHHHRAEHWIVVSGTALVTRGDESFLLSENESTYIPLGQKHRLENPGKVPLAMIEVQSGSYLGEDDIVRFDDTYGRA